MRTGIAAAGIAVMVGIGVAACGSPKPVGSASPAPSAASPSTSDSPSPSPVAVLPQSAAPRGPAATAPIPDSAFFTPPKNRTRTPPFKIYDGRGDMPSLCNAKFASDKLIGRQRARHIFFHAIDAPADSIPNGTVDQTIAVYKPGGAVAAMTDFRAAVAACPKENLGTGGTSLHRFLTPYALGDDAILVERTWSNPPNFPVQTPDLLAVVRIGDVITILWSTGWEGIEADAQVTKLYSELAVKAIQKWRS